MSEDLQHLLDMEARYVAKIENDQATLEQIRSLLRALRGTLPAVSDRLLNVSKVAAIKKLLEEAPDGLTRNEIFAALKQQGHPIKNQTTLSVTLSSNKDTFAMKDKKWRLVAPEDFEV